jgi:1-acyl-sn-glycerol-3-phosphate acyltransferase
MDNGDHTRQSTVETPQPAVTETSSAFDAERVLETVRAVAAELHPGPGLSAPALDSALDRDLGFDSLGRAELVARIERDFSIALPDPVLATAESPRDLLRAVLAELGRGRARQQTEPMAGISVGTAEGIPDAATTLTDVLLWHEQRHGERAHVRFYADDAEGEVLTYGALAAGARAIAAGLQAAEVHPGETVALMLPTGREYLCSFLGILLAGAVPVPMYPPARVSRIEEHVRRHLRMLENCRATALITSPEIRPVGALLRQWNDRLRTVATADEIAGSAGPARVLATPSPDQLAFLQYTSGSTGDPKGVMLTHANLLTNIRAMARAIEATSADVFVSWLPLYHDMGLIAAWLGCLHHATPLVLLSPLQFLARPGRWLRAIHRFRGTISGGPNFAYELCLRRISDGELADLDLSPWRVAFNGAEPVGADTLERFCGRFAAAGFRRGAMMPVYGLAENSVGVAFPPLDRGPLIDRILRRPFEIGGRAVPTGEAERDLRFVACGRPLPGHELRVVDTAGREVPERQEGRIQFRGPSSTQGYFRNPEATRGLFDGDWLNTGDLGYVAEGDVYVTGRSKDLVIRAGRNIHPAELEEAIGSVPGVIPGRVSVFGSADPASGSERLVVIAETRKRAAGQQREIALRINDIVTDQVGEPADDVVTAPPGTVPRTSSGKIRRAASRAIYEAGAIGKPQLPAWRQLLRLRLAALPARSRRFAADLGATGFAAYAWLVTVLVSPPFWLAAVLLPLSKWRWRAARAGVRLILALTGTRLTVIGVGNLPVAARPCLYVCNHLSYLDGFVLLAALPRPVAFIAKAELARSLVTRLPLARLGIAFVERFDVRRGLSDYRNVVDLTRRGAAPMFFAEGTFRRMPGLLPFHMGAFAAAVETALPIVPIAIRGTRNILRGGSWFPRRGAVTVTIEAPLSPLATGERWQRAVDLRDRVRAAILRRCGEPDLGGERRLG